MLRHVGDEMVDVVRRLPPADGETTTKVGDEGSNHGINEEGRRYSAMTRIVRSEHDLLPEHAEEQGRYEVPLDVEEVCKGSKKNAIADRLFCVFRVSALVEALGFDLFVKVAVVFEDRLLSFGVNGGVVRDVILYFLLFQISNVLLPQA